MKTKSVIVVTMQQFIVYAIMFFIASCEIPVMEISDMQIEYQEIDTEIITPEDPEIEEKKEMTIKPIKTYQNYVFTENKKLYGIIRDKKELIVLEDSENQLHPFNDFFTDSGDVYFSVKETVIDETDPENVTSEEVAHYYSQVDDEVSEFVNADDFPAKKESVRVEMGIAPWSIITGDYKGTAISSVSQLINADNKPVKNFLFVDGYSVTNDVLWFSVPDGVNGAEKGLWYSVLNSGRFVKVSEYGRIW